MKTIIALMLMVSVSACGAKGLEKLAACGECLEGVQALTEYKELSTILTGTELNLPDE